VSEPLAVDMTTAQGMAAGNDAFRMVAPSWRGGGRTHAEDMVAVPDVQRMHARIAQWTALNRVLGTVVVNDARRGDV